MTTETKNIHDVLSEVLTEIANNRDQQRSIEDYLNKNHGMVRGSFIELVSNPDKIDNLEDEQIAVIINAIYEITQDERIIPRTFFAPKEIKAIAKYEFEQIQQAALPYTIENVLAMPTNKDFLTIMSYQELASLWHGKVITYNYDTQRLSKKRLNAKGKTIEKPDVNTKSVKNITRLMLEGKYKPDTILLNVLVNGSDHIAYDSGELTIYEGTEINLIDGMHRLQAILNVIEEDPNYEGYINVSIKYYPLAEAQFALGQVNTVNRFDKTLVKHYMGETQGAQIAKSLMNIPELHKRISIKTSLDKKLNLLTNFAVLSDSIEAIFEPESSKDRYDITEVLTKFFSYMIGAFPNEFGTNLKTRTEIAKTSWITHHNLFVGFVVIAKKLYDKYGKEFPVDEIVRIINSIDFNRETSDLTEIMSGQGKVNSNKVKAQIRKLFEEKCDELLK